MNWDRLALSVRVDLDKTAQCHEFKYSERKTRGVKIIMIVNGRAISTAA